MPLKTTVVTLAALAFSSLALADDAKKNPPRKSTSRGDDIVCFAEAPTGSHIRKRTCMTQAERERRKQADQEAMKKFQGRPTRPASTGGD